MKTRKKIIFVIPSLTAGGAERVMSFVATNISKTHFEVSLWVSGFEKNTAYKIEGISVRYFNKSRVLHAIPAFFTSLKKAKPDVVISSISHLNITMGLLSIFNPKTKFIGREANVLSILKKYSTSKRFYDFKLLNFSYKFLDIILCQSSDMYNDMKFNYKIPESKLRIINNPITDNFELKLEKEGEKEVVQFITVARLKKQKGHERILKSLSKLTFPFQYTIVGDGPEKDNLFNLINELGLQDKIKHVPFTNEVSKFLSKSDFFLQGSHVEGFPNCLIESCSVGTPIIAFRAPGGLNEIIEDGINGFIADNEKEFVENIIESTKNHKWDVKIISDSVNIKFNKEKIIQKYEELFLEL